RGHSGGSRSRLLQADCHESRVAAESTRALRAPGVEELRSRVPTELGCRVKLASAILGVARGALQEARVARASPDGMQHWLNWVIRLPTGCHARQHGLPACRASSRRRYRDAK